MASISRTNAREYRVIIRAYGSKHATARTFIHCRLHLHRKDGWEIEYSHHEGQRKRGRRWQTSVTWVEDLTDELSLFIRQSVIHAIAEADLAPNVTHRED